MVHFPARHVWLPEGRCTMKQQSHRIEGFNGIILWEAKLVGDASPKVLEVHQLYWGFTEKFLCNSCRLRMDRPCHGAWYTTAETADLVFPPNGHNWWVQRVNQSHISGINRCYLKTMGPDFRDHLVWSRVSRASYAKGIHVGFVSNCETKSPRLVRIVHIKMTTYRCIPILRPHIFQVVDYPLANSHRTMENQHFYREHSRNFDWAMFSSYVTIITRGYIQYIP